MSNSADLPPAGNDFTFRLATPADLPALRLLMADAIGTLQKAFLTEAQIEASRALMGLDTQLIADGTYFIVLGGDQPAGCGGWSRRATLFGGDHTPGRDAALLDPSRDAARIRAMYTAPAFARQGVGRLVLRLCEAAAAEHRFTRVELAATLAGLPLYTACDYTVIEAVPNAAVPLFRMTKTL
jgi:GNAT superfamily N-acetyltransferase